MIGFLKRIFKNKRLEDNTNLQIYCQACGKDITSEGGDVSSSGRIYCHGYKEDESRCWDHEMIMMAQGKIPSGITIFNYRTSQELQNEIKKGKLKEYNLLEKINSSN